MCLWSELWTLLQKSYQAPSRPSAMGQAEIMPEIPSARANTVQNGLTPPMTNRKPEASADFRFRCCFGYLTGPPQ